MFEEFQLFCILLMQQLEECIEFRLNPHCPWYLHEIVHFVCAGKFRYSEKLTPYLHFWIVFCICMPICIVSWILMIFNTFLERFYLDNLNQETCLCFELFFKYSMSGPNDIKKLMMQILIMMEQNEWVQICRYTRNVRFHDDILTVGIKTLGLWEISSKLVSRYLPKV